MGGKTRDGTSAPIVTPVEPDTVADLHERIDVLSAFTGGIIFEIDREGRYLAVWSGEPQLLARPASELVGRTVMEVLGPAIGERFHQTFRSVVDTGEPAAFDYTLDVPAGRRTFSCVARARDARHSGERRITLLVRDVTDAKALEAKLLQAERLAALGLLAASVGHEIRQPLSYVLTSVERLERDFAARATPAAQAALENIRTGAQRIDEIASSLALLATQRRAMSVIDVRRPLQAALDLCASELSRVRVDRSIGDVPPVVGDEGELCQVFANILLNAAQAAATRDDSAQRIVQVATTADREVVMVSVTDNGPGIAPDTLAHIFDPFFTTKQDQGGTGLGLFVTRGIVETHGGTMAVESEPGGGTSVVVALPVAKGSSPPLAANAKEPPTGVRRSVVRPAERAAPRRRLSVLVVDDEPRFVESLRLALEDSHDVETQTKAVLAIALVEEDPKRFDVVLCDLSMPDLDGAAFYARMEALGIADRFVLMTGGAFTERASEFMRRGACPRIGKPFLLERLLALFEDVTRDRPSS
ncbi:MAG: Histidine kinase [Labilithrix sp.]|nr:Histidine kinase [Labilithrix sp.]